MTTDENLPKPEHGIIQSQDVHEIEKEPETDSVEKQNLFPPSLITVQIIRTALELILVVLLLPLLSNPLVLILFLPFGLHFILQAVAWSRAEKETRIASVTVTNIYSLVIVSPLATFYIVTYIKLESIFTPGLADQPWTWLWVIGVPAFEVVISIVMIVVMNVIKRNDLRDFQGKRITVAKPRIYDDVLEGSNSGAYETDGGLKPLRNHHDKSDAKVPRQHINVRSQKKD